MSTTTGPRLGLAFLTLFALATRGYCGQEADGVRRAQLSFRAVERWDLIVPLETWRPVDGEIRLGELAFKAAEADGRLLIDTTGDGKTDRRTGVNRQFLVLKGKDAMGERFHYALRLRKAHAGWVWSTSGTMSGRLTGRQMHLIDRNGNGRFDDYGQDAMVVGSGVAASLLSRVVNLGGDLFDLEVSPDGSEILASPFEGETATLDVHTGFEGKAELVAAVFASGELSFNAADSRKLLVPAGRYRFLSGFAKGGAETVHMRGGKMPPVALEPGAVFTLRWGGPLTAEFDYTVFDTQLTVHPDVAFHGALGEEYYTFKPDARSPKVIVRDRGTGRTVQSGRFGGCCGGGFSAYKGKVPAGVDLDITIEHARSIFGKIQGKPRQRLARVAPTDR